jgi:hypothetical protein
MNFKETCIELRRRVGILNPNSKEDIEWMVKKIIRENQEVFDRLV